MADFYVVLPTLALSGTVTHARETPAGDLSVAFDSVTAAYRCASRGVFEINGRRCPVIGFNDAGEPFRRGDVAAALAADDWLTRVRTTL